MAFQTFAPTVAPSPGTTFKPKITLNRADFGDGYVQASPRGLNHIRESMELSWHGLTEPQMILIRTFFETHGGYTPFWYQPRGRPEALLWMCESWTVSDAAPWRVTGTLVEWFGPGE
ncbi:MAG: phage tail protein [Roseovarius sp.]